VDQLTYDRLGSDGRILRSSTQACQGRYLGKVQENRLLWVSSHACVLRPHLDGPELVSECPQFRLLLHLGIKSRLVLKGRDAIRMGFRWGPRSADYRNGSSGDFHLCRMEDRTITAVSDLSDLRGPASSYTSTDYVLLRSTEFQVSASIFSLHFRLSAIDPITRSTVHIFRDATVSGAMIATFLSGMVFYAQLFFLPQYFQVVRGDSAIRSGILLLPLIVVQTVT
jgi:hypothetical protein